jgi:hypothetical protein
VSDLKYRSPEELRQVIRSSESYRETLKTAWEQEEAEANRLLFSAAERRKKWHNVGQRVVWARIYLAQKEVAEVGAERANSGTDTTDNGQHRPAMNE